MCLPYVPISSSLLDKVPKLRITSVKCVNINLKHAQFFFLCMSAQLLLCVLVYIEIKSVQGVLVILKQLAVRCLHFCLHCSPYTQMIICFQFRFHSGPHYFLIELRLNPSQDAWNVNLRYGIQDSRLCPSYFALMHYLMLTVISKFGAHDIRPSSLRTTSVVWIIS